MINHITRITAALCAVLTISGSAASLSACGGGGSGGNCCKVCDTGKACGDTCIAANQTCNSSGGCACNK